MFIFEYSKFLFWISKITFLDISDKTPFWYNFWYPEYLFWIC